MPEPIIRTGDIQTLREENAALRRQVDQLGLSLQSLAQGLTSLTQAVNILIEDGDTGQTDEAELEGT